MEEATRTLMHREKLGKATALIERAQSKINNGDASRFIPIQNVYKAITVDSTSTNIREDGFDFAETSNGGFRVRIFLNHIADIINSDQFIKDALLNDFEILISKKVCKQYMSFEDGVARPAKILEFHLDKQGNISFPAVVGHSGKVRNSGMFIASFLNRQAYNFAEFDRHIDNDEQTKRFCNVVRKAVKSQMNALEEFSSSSKTLVMDLMSLGNWVCAKLAHHHKIPILYKQEDAEGNLTVSAKPQLNLKRGTSYYTEFTKPGTNVIADINHFCIDYFIKKNRPVLSEEQMEEIAERLNEKLEFYRGNPEAQRFILKGEGAEYQHKTYLTNNRLEDVLGKSPLYEWMMNGRTEEGFNKILGKLKSQDYYAILFNNRNSIEFDDARRAINNVLKVNDAIAINLVENAHINNPEIISRVSLITTICPDLSDNGKSKTAYQYQFVHVDGTVISASQQSFSKRSAAKYLLEKISCNKAVFESPEVVKEDYLGIKGAVKYQAGSKGSFNFSANEIRKYADLDQQIARIEGQTQDSKSTVRALASIYGWKLEEVVGFKRGDEIKFIKLKLTGEGFGELKKKEFNNVTDLSSKAYDFILNKIKDMAVQLKQFKENYPDKALLKPDKALNRWVDIVLASANNTPSTEKQ